MSVTDVMTEVENMTDEQLRELEALLRRRRVEAARRTGVHGGIRPGFEDVMQRIFTTHADLLHKLAQ